MKGAQVGPPAELALANQQSGLLFPEITLMSGFWLVEF